MLPLSGTVATSYTIHIYVLARHRELVTSLNSAKKTIIKQICTTTATFKLYTYLHTCTCVCVYM